MNLIQLLKEELETEERFLTEFRENSVAYPDKKLTHSKGKDGFINYYTKDPGTRKRAYIRKTEPNLLRRIAYGRYLREGISIMTQNINVIEKLISNLHDYTPDSIIASLPKSYRLAISELKGLQEEPVIQSENPKDRDQLIHMTSTGLLVRSKGELSIAEELSLYKLIYRYEMALELIEVHVDPKTGRACSETVIKYPDFTIFLADETVIYWEHCGLFDKNDYREDQFKKFKLYYDNDIYPPKNLIVTMDGDGKPLNIMTIRRIIVNLLLPFA